MGKNGHVLCTLPELRGEGGGNVGATSAIVENTDARPFPEAGTKGDNFGAVGEAQTGDEGFEDGIEEDRGVKSRTGGEGLREEFITGTS